MDRDPNILKSAAPTPQDVADQPEQKAMPQTTQELAAWCLQQPESERLPKADKRHLFAMESWPRDLPIKPRDVLRTIKLYHRVKELEGQ